MRVKLVIMATSALAALIAMIGLLASGGCAGEEELFRGQYCSSTTADCPRGFECRDAGVSRYSSFYGVCVKAPACVDASDCPPPLEEGTAYECIVPPDALVDEGYCELTKLAVP